MLAGNVRSFLVRPACRNRLNASRHSPDAARAAAASATIPELSYSAAASWNCPEDSRCRAPQARCLLGAAGQSQRLGSPQQLAGPLEGPRRLQGHVGGEVEIASLAEAAAHQGDAGCQLRPLGLATGTQRQLHQRGGEPLRLEGQLCCAGCAPRVVGPQERLDGQLELAALHVPLGLPHPTAPGPSRSPLGDCRAGRHHPSFPPPAAGAAGAARCTWPRERATSAARWYALARTKARRARRRRPASSQNSPAAR
jgi:hypothetical protein